MPFPPVYGTVAFAVYDAPLVAVAENVAAEQLIAVILGVFVSTTVVLHDREIETIVRSMPSTERTCLFIFIRS